MISDWQTMNDNQLRAHLYGARMEREIVATSEDCGYSDEEFDAINREAKRRRLDVPGVRLRPGRRSEAMKGH